MENDYQMKFILFYLKEFGSITAREAKQLCGCDNLQIIIRDLKKLGIPITKDTRTYKNNAGNKVRYSIYKLEVHRA